MGKECDPSWLNWIVRRWREMHKKEVVENGQFEGSGPHAIEREKSEINATSVTGLSKQGLLTDSFAIATDSTIFRLMDRC